MKTYATTNGAKELKNALKEVYKDIFNVEKFTKKEKNVYDEYMINQAFDIFEGQSYNKYTGEKKELLDSALAKVKGDKLNSENKAKALDVYKKAYANHENHIQPKWYQFTKRYAYWKEAKALESYENMLMEKGVMHMEILAAKVEGLGMLTNSGKVDLNTYNSDYDLVTNNKTLTTIDLNEESKEMNNDFVNQSERELSLDAMLSA